jgi:hypothetical protein
MAEKPVPTEPGLVACDVCLKEIPESVAMSQEGDEYTQHFCGLECYEQWKRQGTRQSVPESEEIDK